MSYSESYGYYPDTQCFNYNIPDQFYPGPPPRMAPQYNSASHPPCRAPAWQHEEHGGYHGDYSNMYRSMYNHQAPYSSSREGSSATRVQQKVNDTRYVRNENGYNHAPETNQYPIRPRKREKGQRGKGSRQNSQSNVNTSRRSQASEVASVNSVHPGQNPSDRTNASVDTDASLMASGPYSQHAHDGHMEELGTENDFFAKPSSTPNVWGSLSFCTITPVKPAPTISSETYYNIVHQQEMKRQAQLANTGPAMSDTTAIHSLNTPLGGSVDSVSESNLSVSSSLRIFKPDGTGLYYTKTSLQPFNFLPKEIGNMENVALCNEHTIDDLTGSDVVSDTASDSRDSMDSTGSASRMSLAYAVPFTPNTWQPGSHTHDLPHTDTRELLNSKHTAFKPRQAAFFNAIPIRPVASVSNALPI